MLRSSPTACYELQETWLWTYKSVEAKEEAQVDVLDYSGMDAYVTTA